MKFTVRDYFWVVLLLSVVLGWAFDRSNQQRELQEVRKQARQAQAAQHATEVELERTIEKLHDAEFRVILERENAESKTSRRGE